MVYLDELGHMAGEDPAELHALAQRFSCAAEAA